MDHRYTISAPMEIYTLTLLPLFSVIVGVAFLVVHVMFAIGVYRDGKKLHPTVFVEPWVWALATLFGGVMVATGYWFIHRSSFSVVHKKKTRNLRSGIFSQNDTDTSRLD